MAGDNGNGRWRFYELGEAADALGIRMSTLFFYLNTGRLQMIYSEGRYKIRDIEIENYLKHKKKNWSKCRRPKRRIINNEQNSRMDSVM